MASANSNYIQSTVLADARRESSETLSFQGLSSSVWALVAFSLLVVSILATYLSFKGEKKNRGGESPLNSWMNSVWIYAADILNNCVAGVTRSGPARQLRSCWLLALVFLIQFWCAGMKSDLLLDHSSFVDSLEDLVARPKLLCLVQKKIVNPFALKKDDLMYENYRKMKKRLLVNSFDENSSAIFCSGKGVLISQEKTMMIPEPIFFEKLRKNKRKLYFGKERYGKRYSFMHFNKRLPPAIKEDVDYLTSRITETQQLGPYFNWGKFKSREFLYYAPENSDTMTWSRKSVRFLSPVFRLWIIGLSLATVAFCVEFYRSRVSRRKPIKVAPHHSIEIRIRS